MRRISQHQTAFQKFELWGDARQAEIRVAGAIHAWRHENRFLSGLAWDLIAAAPLLRPDGPPRTVLMLGLAGGTSLRILRHLLPEARLTAVEIDGELIEAVRGPMRLDALGAEIVVGDAYAWLANNRRRFDVVFDDIYAAGAEDVYRPQGWNPELLGHLRRGVAPGGLLCANLVTGPGHRRMQSAFRRTMRAAFSAVASLKTPGCLNEVLVGGEAVLPPRGLRGWRERFAHRRDREFWDLVRVGRLADRDSR
jgi:predicted O-methyltransferase YrrM